MQGYFKEKTQNAPRPSEHPPVVGGEKTNTEYTGSLEHNSVSRVCYITSIDRCRRDPGYAQYHRNNYMLIISSTYQNAPGPFGHTNIKVRSEAAITELLHGIGSTVYYSDLNRHVSTQEKLPHQA